LLLVFFGLFGLPIFRLFGSWGRFDVACAVFLLEPLYSPGGIDIFLLAGIERMAHRADLCVDFFDGTAGLERTAAAAMDHHLIVFWMYLFFHNYNAPRYLKHCILTILAAFAIEIFCNYRFQLLPHARQSKKRCFGLDGLFGAFQRLFDNQNRVSEARKKLKKISKKSSFFLTDNVLCGK